MKADINSPIEQFKPPEISQQLANKIALLAITCVHDAAYDVTKYGSKLQTQLSKLVRAEGSNPAELLKDPGFWYFIAAFVTVRKSRLKLLQNDATPRATAFSTYLDYFIAPQRAALRKFGQRDRIVKALYGNATSFDALSEPQKNFITAWNSGVSITPLTVDFRFKSHKATQLRLTYPTTLEAYTKENSQSTMLDLEEGIESKKREGVIRFGALIIKKDKEIDTNQQRLLLRIPIEWVTCDLPPSNIQLDQFKAHVRIVGYVVCTAEITTAQNNYIKTYDVAIEFPPSSDENTKNVIQEAIIWK